MAEGWIRLHRKLAEHTLWQQKRVFSKAEAWIDILMMVNHADRDVIMGNEIVHCPKGGKITSIGDLADRWGWSRHKVHSFLKLLEFEKMLSQNGNAKGTVITVVNWDIYQGEGNAKGTRRERSGNAQGTLRDTNKNDKNDKNEKKDIYISSCAEIIITYLNQKANTNYRPTSADTKKHISGRINDGFTVDDFKIVIDKKCTEWLGTEWEKYLRPQTLFTPKNFESYLNQKQGGENHAQSQRSGIPWKQTRDILTAEEGLQDPSMFDL